MYAWRCVPTTMAREASSPSMPCCADSRASGFTYWPSLAQAPCWQTESSPCHHRDHSHRRTRKHQSQPASHPHHPGHHHHHLLRAAVWHREYWQIVWRIYAAMVPAAGRGGSFQHHVLPIDTEGFQPHYAAMLLAKSPEWFLILGAVFLCTTGAEALFRPGTLRQKEHRHQLGLRKDHAHSQLSGTGSMGAESC